MLISDTYITPILKMGLSNKMWLINHNWGMMPADDIKILEYCERDKFIFPIQGEKDIRIIKWDGGKHFYAKIGNEDVVIDNEQKWNTKERAREMALQYLKEA